MRFDVRSPRNVWLACSPGDSVRPAGSTLGGDRPGWAVLAVEEQIVDSLGQDIGVASSLAHYFISRFYRRLLRSWPNKIRLGAPVEQRQPPNARPTFQRAGPVETPLSTTPGNCRICPVPSSWRDRLPTRPEFMVISSREKSGVPAVHPSCSDMTPGNSRRYP